MLRINLLAKAELALYEHIWLSFLQATKPFFILQLTALVFCTALFFDVLTLWQVSIYWFWVLLYSVVVVLHTQYGMRHKLFIEPENAWQLSMILLVYLSLGYATWGWLILTLLELEAENVEVVIVIAAACGAFAINSFAGFQRVFLLVMLLAVVGLCGFLYAKFGLSALPYVVAIVAVGVFQYLLLVIQNKKLLESLSLKSQNLDMVDDLQVKNEQLAQANLSQSRYLSAASHDLRQPLHALALIADDVRRKNRNSQIDQPLIQIERAIDSLSKSFDAMLNLSRLDAGVIQPKIQAVSLQRLWERLRVEFEVLALEKKLRFVTVPTRLWVEADEGVLYSILSNFVSNAIRYTDVGGVLIGVRRKGALVMPVVYDTGLGIPAEKLREVFGEYRQLSYDEQRTTGGVGLGLTISERMATLLNARIVVRSEFKHGSVFGVCLPPALAIESAPDAVISTTDYLKGKKTIVLDDDEVVVEKLDELFRSWGMDVSVVLSSEMLQELIDDEGYVDLIVSDHHLGLARENGLDVLQYACEVQADNPPQCVLITGDTTIDLVNAAKKQSVHLLHKPVSPARLRAFLNNLLKDSVQ